MSIFLKNPEEYIRDINVLKHCHHDHAYFLHKETGKPFDFCLDYVIKQTSKDGQFPLVDPEVLSLRRGTNGDKERKVTTFSDYLNDIQRNNYIVSPSLAVYKSTAEEESESALYITGNIALRAKAKKEMFEADLAKNQILVAMKEIEQTSRKLNNNAMSGAQASFSTPLFNKSAHSSLTSTCRTETSYGNANNEKFITGNRHYWCPDVVIANIISICTSSDLLRLDKAMQRYGIHYPTAEEAMECISYSTDFYWRNNNAFDDFFSLLSKLDPVERAAFVYIGDLHHLAKHNDSLVRNFLTRLSSRITDVAIDDPSEVLKKLDADTRAFIGLLCHHELSGTSIEKIKIDNPVGYNTVAATFINIQDTLSEYEDMIKALWVTPNMPGSIANIPSIIRRAAITSDTDSTIFTAQDWTRFITGSDKFTDQSKAISATITYLASQLIANILAQMSANIGVDKKHLFKLGMKNEYNFPVFVLTSRAKHYYAYQGAREGNVYEHYERETKGVELRNSNIPPHVNKKLNGLMAFIMDEIIDKQSLSIIDVFDEIALLELDIISTVNRGGYEYMKTGQIKNINSYVNPEQSNYIHYGMWEEVFADKYGHTAPPSYTVVKVSLNADSPTLLKQWVASIKDEDIKTKLVAWLTKKNRKGVTQLLLPENIVSSAGIPEEIIIGVDIRKLIYNTMSGFYLVLESLGIYMIDSDLTKLVSDYHIPTRSKSRFD